MDVSSILHITVIFILYLIFNIHTTIRTTGQDKDKRTQIVFSDTKSKFKQSNIGVNINGPLSFDNAMVASSFNGFFTTVARDLVQKLQVTTWNYGEPQVKIYYETKGIREEQFSLIRTSITTITQMLRGLDTNRASGLDTIPAKFFRHAVEMIATYVTE